MGTGGYRASTSSALAGTALPALNAEVLLEREMLALALHDVSEAA